jgi:hypothetical protein
MAGFQWDIKLFKLREKDKGTAKKSELNATDQRVTALEEAVQIITEGGEVVMGSYFAGDWTDYTNTEDVVLFGAWTASAASA